MKELQYLFVFILMQLRLAGAQDSTATSDTSGSTTSSSMGTSSPSAVQTVDVGEHGFRFDPDTLKVAPGGKVEFHFYPGNHSVAQASFNQPCHPMNDSSIFSGFIAPTTGESDTVFTVTVNDTNPIWYYCGQIGHCQAGMVGVINPPASGSDTLEAFKSAASNANGDSVPSRVQGGTLSTSSPKSSSTSTSETSTSTHSNTATTSASPTTTNSPSPTATNIAGNLQASTDSSIVFILTLVAFVLFM
ncbi:Cupredoxin [Aspergillus pseudotamarii]|uniref:Cupredoxin n=1 Tax=Aspergillus pseudotamarii TaxID=132259 RepID=A0A5N6SLS5_ASPPS|nr:Cupredoxin [Aspergillus pseudotamarii]KAE8135658.1 Cupredoxin [Aspergillus pseudotamarii]